MNSNTLAAIAIAWAIMAGLILVIEVWDRRDRKDKEYVDFDDLTLGQIDRFFEAISDHRASAVIAVSFPQPGADPASATYSQPEEAHEPEEPALMADPEGWHHDAIPSPGIVPTPHDWAHEDLATVVVGAARAWRHGMDGSDETLTEWVDALERAIDRNPAPTEG